MVENLCLLGMLNRPVGFPALYPLLAGAAATAKFALLALCLIYWLALLVVGLGRRLRPA